MEAFWIGCFMLIGLIAGSFFTLVGQRVPQSMSIITPRSHCDMCSIQLSWYELLPIVSYACQKGRCRHCGDTISSILPLTEIGTSLLFGLAIAIFGFQWDTAVALLLIALLHMVSVADVYYMKIPNNILLVSGGLLMVIHILHPETSWSASMIGAGVGFGVLFFIMLVSRGGMGVGDVKLFLVIGFVAGWKETLLILFLASLLGALFGIIFRLAGRLKRGEAIPFAPFISGATILILFWGDTMMKWLVAGS
ncbi:prepilin peptidase [Bacillaceae bacterium SIJ1]|uniref:prepilin peptidase n=1 Tax=Litoribacterium kuwaitense TaxID=1398745 RepID=UPI0013EDE186|nr:A24 family peptidase [Litoribacterium kuwaitense]NGP45492.1 prepilin peptidase [Litoribacterium kuwaitense]